MKISVTEIGPPPPPTVPPPPIGGDPSPPAWVVLGEPVVPVVVPVCFDDAVVPVVPPAPEPEPLLPPPPTTDPPPECVPAERGPSPLTPAGLATSCDVVLWLSPAGTDTPIAPSASCATPWGPFGSVPVPAAMTIATATTTTVPPTRARRFCRPPPLRVRR